MKPIQRFLYFCLFLLLGFSLFQFLKMMITGDTQAWHLYSTVYLLLLLSSTWYFFILLFLADLRPRKFKGYDGGLISVLIPCYNEEPELLRRCVDSLINARGNKEIIIIDDGSKNAVHEEYVRIKEAHKDKISIHLFSQNKGKRHALHHAITTMISHSKYVVTIDSDTILDSNALIRVVEPLADPAIGAATGDVRLLNEKENWLTRMIATYYWIGLNVYKKAQSSIGIVLCCSGCLAAYKTSLIKEIIHEFVNQEFFGERCTHSEDRHLTNLILKRGYNVVYVPAAISYTRTPSTIWGFLKQQQRWKRGYIRESLYTLSHAWRTRPILFLEVLLWDLTAPFIAFGLRIAVILAIFTNIPFFLFFILPSWVVFMMIRYIFVFFYAPDKVRGLFTYAIFYELFLYWMNIYALFTVKNKSWITR